MTQRKAQVTLRSISATDIYQLAQQFTLQRPRKTTRGRPLLYPEALLLTLALLQTARRASYRQLLFGLAPSLAQPRPPRFGHPALSPPDHPRNPLARVFDLVSRAGHRAGAGV